MRMNVINMTTVKEIENAIRKLPDTDRSTLLLKLEDLYWLSWEEQIVSDHKSGKLDSLIAEVKEDINSGHLNDLAEVLNKS